MDPFALSAQVQGVAANSDGSLSQPAALPSRIMVLSIRSDGGMWWCMMAKVVPHEAALPPQRRFAKKETSMKAGRRPDLAHPVCTLRNETKRGISCGARQTPPDSRRRALRAVPPSVCLSVARYRLGQIHHNKSPVDKHSVHRRLLDSRRPLSAFCIRIHYFGAATTSPLCTCASRPARKRNPTLRRRQLAVARLGSLRKRTQYRDFPASLTTTAAQVACTGALSA